MNFTISDVLDFSRIMRNKLSKNFEMVDIRIVIKEIASMHCFQASKQGVEINTHFFNFEEVNFLVRTDFRRLQQVLLNLLSNAIKFTKIGEISIVCSLLFKEKLKKWAVQVSVLDTGIGISNH